MSQYMIMMTDRCNLNCPYCFAYDSMNTTVGDITEYSFRKAVEFGLSSSKSKGIGIIGGEPTLHKRFDEFIECLINDERVESIDVFTNGTTILHHLPILLDSKVYTLINCNPVSIIGNKTQKKIVNGIDKLFETGVPIERVGFGFNLFRENEDLDYYLYLIDKYSMDTIRLSVAVPMKCTHTGKERFSYFNRHLSQVKVFVRELFDRGVVPIFDCNKIPYCLISNEETELRERYKKTPKSWRAVQSSNYLNGYSRCTPSIVVDNSLTAIRCFALSSTTKEKISNFDNLEMLQEYYKTTVDYNGYISDNSKCDTCDYLFNKKCMGGCLIFKQ